MLDPPARVVVEDKLGQSGLNQPIGLVSPLESGQSRAHVGQCRILGHDLSEVFHGPPHVPPGFGILSGMLPIKQRLGPPLAGFLQKTERTRMVPVQLEDIIEPRFRLGEPFVG
ncbi:MAG: hypothetical protein HZB43_01280 [candidate division Zixibacteria bacterium]|nr:hypothetical protein [candidate division Zixibacteria bacterium]